MTENNLKKVGGLLLAAGSSRRLGSPKQLLDFKGKTLLRRATEALVGSACAPIIVVLGAEIESSKAEIGDLNVSVVINEDWPTGMSSSIRKGLEQLLLLEPDIDAAMITLCDQPFVTAEKVGLFIEEFNQADPLIVAARYNEVLGVPALFSSQMFSALFELDGDKGARELIRQTEIAVPINLPEAAIDIDTPEILDSLGIRLKVPL